MASEAEGVLRLASGLPEEPAQCDSATQASLF